MFCIEVVRNSIESMFSSYSAFDCMNRLIEFRGLEFYYYLHYLQVIIILHKGTLQGK